MASIETRDLVVQINLEENSYNYLIDGEPVKLYTLDEKDFDFLDQRNFRETGVFYKFVDPAQLDKINDADGVTNQVGYSGGIFSHEFEGDTPIVRIINPFLITAKGEISLKGIDFEDQTPPEGWEKLPNGNYGLKGYEDSYLIIQGNSRKKAIDEIVARFIKASKNLRKMTGSDKEDAARELFSLSNIIIDPIPFVTVENLTITELVWLQSAVNNTLRQHAYSSRSRAMEMFAARRDQYAGNIAELDALIANTFGVSTGTLGQWKALQSFPGVILNMIDSDLISSATATKFNTKWNTYVKSGLVPVGMTIGKAMLLAVSSLQANMKDKALDNPKPFTLKDITKAVETSDWYLLALEALQAREQSELDADGTGEGGTGEGSFGEGEGSTGEGEGDASPKLTIEQLREQFSDLVARLFDHMNDNSTLMEVVTLVVSPTETESVPDSQVQNLTHKISALLTALENPKLIKRVKVAEPENEPSPESSELAPV